MRTKIRLFEEDRENPIRRIYLYKHNNSIVIRIDSTEKWAIYEYSNMVNQLTIDLWYKTDEIMAEIDIYLESEEEIESFENFNILKKQLKYGCYYYLIPKMTGEEEPEVLYERD